VVLAGLGFARRAVFDIEVLVYEAVSALLDCGLAPRESSIGGQPTYLRSHCKCVASTLASVFAAILVTGHCHTVQVVLREADNGM
jgi:hypothetical protein